MAKVASIAPNGPSHNAPAVKVYDPPRELEREPLVLHQRSLSWITDAIAEIGRAHD